MHWHSHSNEASSEIKSTTKIPFSIINCQSRRLISSLAALFVFRKFFIYKWWLFYDIFPLPCYARGQSRRRRQRRRGCIACCWGENLCLKHKLNFSSHKPRSRFKHDSLIFSSLLNFLSHCLEGRWKFFILFFVHFITRWFDSISAVKTNVSNKLMHQYPVLSYQQEDEVAPSSLTLSDSSPFINHVSEWINFRSRNSSLSPFDGW